MQEGEDLNLMNLEPNLSNYQSVENVYRTCYTEAERLRTCISDEYDPEHADCRICSVETVKPCDTDKSKTKIIYHSKSKKLSHLQHQELQNLSNDVLVYILRFLRKRKSRAAAACTCKTLNNASKKVFYLVRENFQVKNDHRKLKNCRNNLFRYHFFDLSTALDAVTNDETIFLSPGIHTIFSSISIKKTIRLVGYPSRYHIQSNMIDKGGNTTSDDKTISAPADSTITTILLLNKSCLRFEQGGSIRDIQFKRFLEENAPVQINKNAIAENNKKTHYFQNEKPLDNNEDWHKSSIDEISLAKHLCTLCTTTKTSMVQIVFLHHNGRKKNVKKKKIRKRITNISKSSQKYDYERCEQLHFEISRCQFHNNNDGPCILAQNNTVQSLLKHIMCCNCKKRCVLDKSGTLDVFNCAFGAQTQKGIVSSAPGNICGNVFKCSTISIICGRRNMSFGVTSNIILIKNNLVMKPKVTKSPFSNNVYLCIFLSKLTISLYSMLMSPSHLIYFDIYVFNLKSTVNEFRSKPTLSVAIATCMDG